MQTMNQRLTRSRTDTIIAGVAGGIARYLAIDPVFVRLAFIALFFTGVGSLLYPVLWIIMPKEGSHQATPQQAENSQQRTPRYDSMTGERISDETEIPVTNLNSAENGVSQERRNRLFGIILVGIGGFFLLKLLLGPAFGTFIWPALLIGAGILLLRRG